MDKVDPSIKKWVKWVIVLLVLRRERPIQWSSFLSLNPLLHKAVNNVFSKVGKPIGKPIENKDTPETKRQVTANQIANFLSSTMLYSAIADNPKFPSDYGIIYIWSSYITELNPPSHSQILPTPNFSKYFKISYYDSPKLRSLYNNKNYIIFPLVFGQILSNYLTPTTYKLNQRYLSTFIKTRILNPIWINYSLGVNQQSLNWLKLFKNYIIHNLVVSLIIGGLSFKKRIVDHYYELKHKVYNANGLTSFKEIVTNYFAYVFHRSNSIVNFIYLPNLISIFLISLTSSLVKFITNSTHKKNYFKLYIKVIGFIAGFVTLYMNSMDLIPDYNYHLTNYDLDTINIHESENIRRIQDSFVNGINVYLIKLIILQKWRILKENHPVFRMFKLRSWNRLENIVFCYGIFKLMNLNDFLKFTNGKDYGLRQNSLIKAVGRIM